MTAGASPLGPRHPAHPPLRPAVRVGRGLARGANVFPLDIREKGSHSLLFSRHSRGAAVHGSVQYRRASGNTRSPDPQGVVTRAYARVGHLAAVATDLTRG